MMSLMKRKFPTVTDETVSDIEARLTAIEARLRDHESRLPPSPPKTLAELLEAAWRANSLTADERDLLVRGRTRGLDWNERIQLELIARRADDKPPVKPEAELIEQASAAKHLTEAEAICIAGARQWLSAMGELPDELRQGLERIVFLRAPA